ncbi:LytR/AlgR family response regulator transcription factor [Draconibacterium sp.]|uniref:LytR/AlgR family response regulator transcription factor n=1 Tax=Draconibacterium sp. TaxID=1965318 RepID=UPI0035614DD3
MPYLEIFIIDDEPDAGHLLKNLLKEYSVIQIKEVFTNALHALDAVIIQQPQVIFLDIDMPEITGIEFLQEVNKYSPNTKVIFVTAFKHYALEALHNNAFDYIYKPVSKAELRRVVYKIINAINGEKQKLTAETNSKVLLKTAEGHHYIDTEQILFLEADSNYTNLILKDGKKLLTSVNLGKLHKQIPETEFVRISRKHIINKNYLLFMNFCKRYCIISNNQEEYQLEVSIKMKDLKHELS